MNDKTDSTVLERISRAKKELGKSAVILAHHYQRDEVVRFADFTGDSFQLCREGSRSAAQFIVFAGVHFMAESAAVLGREDQIVVMPVPRAGCSMADMADREQVERTWEDLWSILGNDPETIVTPITYMNSTASLKAFTGKHGGSVCTSSNARGILEWAFTKREKVFFFPDQHLGRNTGVEMGIPLDRMAVWDPKKPGGGGNASEIRNARIILWKGHCCVHQKFKAFHVEQYRERKPGGMVIVHPECDISVARLADRVGSTAYIIEQIEKSAPGSAWAVGTEISLVDRLKAQHPDKAIESLSGSPSLCGSMYLTDPESLASVLENLVQGNIVNRITVSEETKLDARAALERMLAVRR